MTFRTRVAAAAAIVVAIGIVLASGIAYKTARDALVGSADQTLDVALHSLTSPYCPQQDGPVASVNLDCAPGVLIQLVSASGRSVSLGGGPGDSDHFALPVDDLVKGVAKGTSPTPTYRTVEVHGIAVRELIVQLPAGTFVSSDAGSGTLPTNAALVLAVQIQGIEQRLSSLGLTLFGLALFGIVIAALLGWLAARTALRPLRDVTRDIEEVAETLDVTRRVPEGTDDELGRLRRTFNTLLAELELSQDAQRQLILDASHELRTPLTSLRANAQVLGRIDELPADDVSQLSDDMVTQVDELTRLVGDLTELTRGERSEEVAVDIDLDDLLQEVCEVASVHARTKQIDVEVSTSPCRVHAKRQRLVRAIGNLLDNAIKFTPVEGRIRVTCAAGSVIVEDSGPGLSNEDLPHIFDRFYRSADARGLPGSGLGLAIVQQVAAEASGRVEAGRSDELGGARMELVLPTIA